MTRWRRTASIAAAILVLAAARPASAQDAAALDRLPGWQDDALVEVLPALRRGCARLDPAQAGPSRMETVSAPSSTPDWPSLCAEASQVAPTEAAIRAFLARHWRPAPVRTGLLTGYYEPELRGAARPHGPYRTPLRAMPPRPAEPAGLLPDRAAIEAGALDGTGLELVWVDDPVDAFFLQIQGSGRIRLEGGGVLRLGFAGKNGHPYRSIGRILIDRGDIAAEAMSMQAIRAWLAAATPEARRALLHANPAYVFFRPLDGLAAEEGPIGTLGAPLTPGRSMAVDALHVPLGTLVWIDTRDPVTGAPIRRLVVAQDTGGAIRGAARGDLFFGWGAEAEARAGLMQDRQARFFLLEPVPAHDPPQATPAPEAAYRDGMLRLD